MLTLVKDSVIYCNNQSIYVRDYYKYITSLLEAILNENELAVNILIDTDEYDFSNKNQTLKIGINTEHTLVKPGGRDMPQNTPVGNVKYTDQIKYHTRIHEFEKLNTCDIIIDYSQPNIFNVRSAGMFNNFSEKHVYVAPCIYKNLYNTVGGRNISSITSFSDTNQLRRYKLLEHLKKSDFDHININCFDKGDLKTIYQKTKTLVNIHQTNEHDTFEELRCLPAILNGVIIVSEYSPLQHLVPYQNMIVWCGYDDMMDQTKEILTNYQEFHHKLFTTENNNILKKLHSQNKKNLETILFNKLL